MRKDHILGAGVSALILGSLFASSYIFPPDKLLVVAPPKEKPNQLQIEWPKDDPPPPPEDQINDPSLKQEKNVNYPPPSPDVPQIPNPGDIIQPLQPPPPFDPNAPINNSVIPHSPGLHGPSSNIEIIDTNKLDQKPAPKAQIPPQYPFELRNAGIEGEVVVEFVVDTNGAVRNAYVVRSTHKEFESAAIQAIEKWKFRPGKKAGRIVNAGRVQQIFTFRIND